MVRLRRQAEPCGFCREGKVRLRQGFGGTTFAKRRLVEAAGVEPASEIAVSQESSCFVRFLLDSPPELRTDKMRRKLVRWSHASNTDRAAHASLLYDVRSQPIGEAVEDGSLF